VSELERVFPLKPASSREGSQPVAVKLTETETETALVAELRRRIEGLERQVQGLEGDKDDLRQERDRLLRLVESATDQVKLLTDQRPRGWLARLLGR
jgi:chromosome segregation ATPase